MQKTEKKYEFRKRLLKVHKENLRDYSVIPDEKELVIQDGFTICLPENAGEVVLTAAKDFADYLLTSMNVASMIKKGARDHQTENEVSYELDISMEKGYRVQVDEKIWITANDERSVAQALYALEDAMNRRKAPYLKKEIYTYRILFSPRMLHSGYGLDAFPNEHLAAIAHAGRDAILVFTKGVNKTPAGFQDFNELVYRAAKYGIDVYAYSYLKSLKHPDEEDAQKFYDELYGSLFQNCPGLKGVVLVGESVEFPSKDTHTTGRLRESRPVGDVPDGKPSPGWWPCIDYPRWLEVVKAAITKYKKDADIVFWTYNWNYAPKEDRIRLIQSLPEGISLNVTFEMGENLPCFDSAIRSEDYTVAFAGPGEYFVSEAIAAKKRGIRLYAMTNTGGLTWDMGVIPYEPFPYQWIRRYQEMMKAHENWGLCGIMESHHFGFWPSFIGQLSKRTLADNGKTMEENLMDVLKEFYGMENIEIVNKALILWSEAITYYTPTDNDQYGAFRIGPAYPLNLLEKLTPTADEHAMFGTYILSPVYMEINKPYLTLSIVRMNDELKSLGNMLRLLEEGVRVLKSIPAEMTNDELASLINLGEYMCCTVVTGMHAKQWHFLKSRLKASGDRDEIRRLVGEMEALAEAEIQNAERAIPLTECDSRLGWEPSMEYLGDADHIRWKIRQVKFMLESELSIFKCGAEV